MSEETVNFDPTKPCWTLDGRKVEFYTIQSPPRPGLPLVGAIEGITTGRRNPVPTMHRWTRDGKYYLDMLQYKFDLTNTPPKTKHRAWVNLYQDGQTSVHTTKQDADQCALRNRVDCRLIEWEE